MKNTFLLILSGILLISCATRTPYKSFKNENRKLTSFSLGAPAFLVHLFADRSDVQEVKQYVKGVRRYHVMTASTNITELSDRFDEMVEHPGYEPMFFYREDGEKVDFYIFQRNDKIKEVVLKYVDGRDLVFLSMQGNITIQSLPEELKDVIAQTGL